MLLEYGFRGDKGVGEKVDSNIDVKIGIFIYFFYGVIKKFIFDMLDGIDVIVFDIQDVGVCFYIYLSILYYVLEVVFVCNIDVIVLDRLNFNGCYVDGLVF